MIKVLIADDQELIRESLKIILDSKPDIEVTDAVSDGLEVKYGASGYLLKGISMDSLVEAINTVYQGQAMINPDIASKVLKFFSKLAVNNETIHVESENVKTLTKNEWAIIEEVSKGKSNKEIAKDLSFSEGTVRNYLSTVLDKLELRDRTQLAIWAIGRGEL